MHGRETATTCGIYTRVIRPPGPFLGKEGLKNDYPPPSKKFSKLNNQLRSSNFLLEYAPPTHPKKKELKIISYSFL